MNNIKKILNLKFLKHIKLINIIIILVLIFILYLLRINYNTALYEGLKNITYTGTLKDGDVPSDSELEQIYLHKNVNQHFWSLRKDAGPNRTLRRELPKNEETNDETSLRLLWSKGKVIRKRGNRKIYASNNNKNRYFKYTIDNSDGSYSGNTYELTYGMDDYGSVFIIGGHTDYTYDASTPISPVSTKTESWRYLKKISEITFNKNEKMSFLFNVGNGGGGVGLMAFLKKKNESNNVTENVRGETITYQKYNEADVIFATSNKYKNNWTVYNEEPETDKTYDEAELNNAVVNFIDNGVYYDKNNYSTELNINSILE